MLIVPGDPSTTHNNVSVGNCIQSFHLGCKEHIFPYNSLVMKSVQNVGVMVEMRRGD